MQQQLVGPAVLPRPRGRQCRPHGARGLDHRGACAPAHGARRPGLRRAEVGGGEARLQAGAARRHGDGRRQERDPAQALAQPRRRPCRARTARTSTSSTWRTGTISASTTIRRATASTTARWTMRPASRASSTIARAFRRHAAGRVALGAVPRRHGGGIRPARLRILRRASAGAAREDRGRDQHRRLASARAREGHRGRRLRRIASSRTCSPTAAKIAEPHADARPAPRGRPLLPLGPLQFREGRRALRSTSSQGRRCATSRTARARRCCERLRNEALSQARRRIFRVLGRQRDRSRTCASCSRSARASPTRRPGPNGARATNSAPRARRARRPRAVEEEE